MDDHLDKGRGSQSSNTINGGGVGPPPRPLDADEEDWSSVPLVFPVEDEGFGSFSGGSSRFYATNSQQSQSTGINMFPSSPAFDASSFFVSDDELPEPTARDYTSMAPPQSTSFGGSYIPPTPQLSSLPASFDIATIEAGTPRGDGGDTTGALPSAGSLQSTNPLPTEAQLPGYWRDPTPSPFLPPTPSSTPLPITTLPFTPEPSMNPAPTPSPLTPGVASTMFGNIPINRTKYLSQLPANQQQSYDFESPLHTLLFGRSAPSARHYQLPETTTTTTTTTTTSYPSTLDHYPHGLSQTSMPVQIQSVVGGTDEVGPSNIFEPVPQLNLRGFAMGESSLADAPVTLETLNYYLYLVNMYKDYVWVYFPLHPAIFDEFNVKYVFTPEGMNEVSSLSVNVYMGIALGAGILGEVKVSAQMELKAREQFNRLVDSGTCDYGLAMAACVFGFYALWWQLDPIQSRQFFQKSIYLCKALGAVNSEAYTRCLYALSFHPETSYEDIKNLRREIQMSKEKEYFGIPCLDTPKSRHESAAGIASAPYHAAPMSSRNLMICAESCRTVANVLLGVRVCRSKSEAPNLSKGEQEDILQGIIAAVETWRRENELAFASVAEAKDPMPIAVTRYCKLLFLAIHAECLKLLGKYDKALNCALEFLKATEYYAADWMSVGAGVPYFVEMILNLFWHIQRYDCLEKQLEIIEPWSSASVFMSNLWEKNMLRLRRVGYDTTPVAKPRGWRQAHAAATNMTGGGPPMEVVAGSVATRDGGGVFTSKVKYGPFGVMVWDSKEEGGGGRMGGRKRKRGPGAFVGLDEPDRNYNRMIRRPKVKRRSVWNSDAHININQSCYEFQSNFRKYFWCFSPLHPTVLDDSNVPYFLSTESGMQEKSPLALSFYVCLSRGAMIASNVTLSKQFFAQAEQILEYLLQSRMAMRDYSIALTVNAMGWHAGYLCLPGGVSEKYLQLAINVCENIGAYNSDVYMRSLFASSHRPSLFDSEKIVANLEKARDSPYYPLTATTPFLDAAEETGKDASAGPIIQFSGARCLSDLQQQMPVSLKTMSNTTSATGILSNITAGISMAKTSGGTVESVLQVLRSVQLFEDLARDIKKDADPSEGQVWPPLFEKYCRLFCFAARAECYLLLGDKTQARALALSFITLLEKPKVKLLFAGINFLMGLVLEILDELQEYPLLIRCLSAIEPWAKAMPVVQQLRTRYLQKIEEIMKPSAEGEASGQEKGGREKGEPEQR